MNHCEVCGEDTGTTDRRRKYCFQCCMDKMVESARRTQQRYPLAYRAHYEVSKAVKRGDLPPVTTHDCTDCGKQAKAYDHRDYSKPLDVEPVCDSCNRLRGPAWPYVAVA